MKFIVRDGFVVHIARVVENAGKKMLQEASYFEGQTVDFVDRAEAALHLHKIEPLDKEAKTLADANVLSVPVPVAAAVDPVVLATAVAAALTAMGFKAPEPVAQ